MLGQIRTILEQPFRLHCNLQQTQEPNPISSKTKDFTQITKLVVPAV